MEELIEKLEQLEREISKEDVVVQYLKEKENIFNDISLISKIESYKQYPSEKVKEEIESSPSFLAYKEQETNVNLLILGINQKFKILRGEFDCKKE